MTRRLLVNLLALLVLALIGGAASAQNQARNAVEEGAPATTPPVEVPADERPEVPAADVELPAAAAVVEDDEEEAGAEGTPSVQAVEDEEEDDEDGFGAIRSLEASAFGRCMDERGGGQEARTACAELRPGPAHRNPAHPNHGKMRGQGQGARPDHAGPPDHAGKPGPPAHAGRPDAEPVSP